MSGGTEFPYQDESKSEFSELVKSYSWIVGAKALQPKREVRGASDDDDDDDDDDKDDSEGAILDSSDSDDPGRKKKKADKPNQDRRRTLHACF